MNQKNTVKDKKEKAFNNWRHNAIHLWFPNGNGLSTIWGYLTYSDNHDYCKDGDKFEDFMDSDTCEIMILEAPEKLIKKINKKYDGDGRVIGYLKMKEWLEIVRILSK